MVRTGATENLKKLSTSKYCIAYLDVLGATKFMKDDSDKFLSDLDSIYRTAQKNVNLKHKRTGVNVSVKIFSDNILLALKLKENNDDIEKILYLAGYIYNNALEYGYPMRGAIVMDNFYENNIFVYGKALVDAVEMEEKLAIYPRIIAKKSVRDLCPKYFYECTDGCFTLNNFMFHLNLNVYRKKLLELCEQYGNNEKIMQKIMWSINFFNNDKVNTQNRKKITPTDIENVMSSQKGENK